VPHAAIEAVMLARQFFQCAAVWCRRGNQSKRSALARDFAGEGEEGVARQGELESLPASALTELPTFGDGILCFNQSGIQDKFAQGLWRVSAALCSKPLAAGEMRISNLSERETVA